MGCPEYRHRSFLPAGLRAGAVAHQDRPNKLRRLFITNSNWIYRANRMIRSHLFSTLCLCVFIFTFASSNAALIDRGSGLIYDSDQDLTWTQDAGMSGMLNWNEATAWAENLVFGSVGGCPMSGILLFTHALSWDRYETTIFAWSFCAREPGWLRLPKIAVN